MMSVDENPGEGNKADEVAKKLWDFHMQTSSIFSNL
jgi:hypothetical protein